MGSGEVFQLLLFQKGFVVDYMFTKDTRWLRELEHSLALAVALSPERIDLEHLPPELQAEPPKRAPETAAPHASTQEQQREELLTLLRKHRGNVSQIAEALGTSRAQVHRLFKRHALDPQAFRS